MALVLVTSGAAAIACSSFTTDDEPSSPDGGDAAVPDVPLDAKKQDETTMRMTLHSVRSPFKAVLGSTASGASGA